MITELKNTLREYYYRLYTNEKRIKSLYKKRLGREVNLTAPERFTDKIQWLKLNWYDPLAEKCADKYEVRQIVEQRIGAEYLNELIGVFDSVKQIDRSKLPKRFVLKGTHGSGLNIICRDLDGLDWDRAERTMRQWLKKNYFLQSREWVYKDIKSRIICEKYLSESDGNISLSDYKFFCFNGRPAYCQVIRGRGEHETIDFYDLKWNRMNFNGLRALPRSDIDYKKPEKYDQMIALAEKLAGKFPFVRVDLYYIKEKIIFGELTFFPLSGMGVFKPDEWDYKMGELLVLPEKVRRTK